MAAELARGLPATDFEDQLAQLYLSMLQLPDCTTAALLAEGYGRENIERLAAVLEERGLVVRASQGRFEVLPPEAALTRYAADLETRARFTRNSAGEMGAVWRRVRGEGGPALVHSGLEVLDTLDDVVSAYRTLRMSAGTRLYAFLGDTPGARRLIEEAWDYGQQVRRPVAAVVLDAQLLARRGILADVQRWASAGHRVRVVPALPFSGLLADEQGAVLDLSGHPGGDTASVVLRRTPALAAVSAFFEMVFAQATPLDVLRSLEEESDGVPLPGRDRRVLALLAAGATDQAIARQLGASVRTVERRVARLMQLLGAGTRFQAGVLAARRGWL